VSKRNATIAALRHSLGRLGGDEPPQGDVGGGDAEDEEDEEPPHLAVHESEIAQLKATVRMLEVRPSMLWRLSRSTASVL
jgi:hypothetical protein